METNQLLRNVSVFFIVTHMLDITLVYFLETIAITLVYFMETIAIFVRLCALLFYESPVHLFVYHISERHMDDNSVVHVMSMRNM